jgi:ArsR family transcriptional regulator, arsenate/arsenite/antimonite-responsive transcriptional repressor / arsenate reductase (thioredoxin)
VATRQLNSVVPPFLVLAGHPVRWRILVELAGSDLQVHELTRVVGRPQGLVSYHLARLRTEGLVSSRKSSFDGRAAYYRVHLDRCGELLGATGAALHPSFASSGPTPAPARRPGKARRRASVLFICTGNGARSQMAEAILREQAGDRVDVVSAGSHPKSVHPNAIRLLAERGIDISGSRSKPIAQFHGRHFDYVITLCDKVREICPEFPGSAQTMHWSIEDPSRATGSLRDTRPVFRALATELQSRIEFLTARIDNEPIKEHARHGR